MKHLVLAVRSLSRTPLATMAAVLTLALAIGANTAIFSVVYGVLIRPLPFSDPSALVQFTSRVQPDGRPTGFSGERFPSSVMGSARSRSAEKATRKPCAAPWSPTDSSVSSRSISASAAH